MPKKVATINVVHFIDGIGTVIALPKEDQWSIGPQEEIFRRERIQIRTQSGGCISTFIKNIELINRGRDRGGIAFTLPRSVKASDIPEGSEMWLERDGSDPILEP